MSKMTVGSGQAVESDDDVPAYVQALLDRLEAQERRIAMLEAESSSAAVPARVADNRAPGETARVGRRGMLTKALAATAAAAILSVAKEPQPAQAGVDGDVVLGGLSPAAGSVTTQTRIVAATSGISAFQVRNGGYSGFTTPIPAAIDAYSVGSNPAFFARNEAGGTGFSALMVSGIGVAADSVSGIGVLGTSGSSDGVRGSSSTGVGVRGSSTGANSGQAGVYGQSTGGSGVFGYSDSNAGVFAQSVNSIAMYAQSSNSYGVYAKGGASQPSVFGDASGNSGPGVYGYGAQNAGVFGESPSNIGVFAKTTGGTGVLGQATGGGWAAQFFGNVNVVGSLTVSGSYPKSAGVPHPDGSVRRMYCMEAPESVFEDWGRGQLQGGRAEVKLDPEFAALVTADDYAVFLQPEGPTALYVSQRTATGFEVREIDDGTAGARSSAGGERSVRPTSGAGTVGFSYRVLAKRKDVIGKVSRLERIEMPRGVRRTGARGVAADDSMFPSSPDRAKTPEAPTLEEQPRGPER